MAHCGLNKHRSCDDCRGRIASILLPTIHHTQSLCCLSMTSAHPKPGSSQRGSSPLLGFAMALAIVLLAAAAGIAAVLLVIFPTAAWVIGYFLPDWVFIVPVLGPLNGSTTALVIGVGVVLATALIQTALWLSRRSALQQLLRKRV